MNQEYEIGFIHGRFQIFHIEHLAYALAAKEKCRKLIVGITSPDPSVSPREEIDPHRSEDLSNPCTYYERMEMIKLALLESGLGISDFNIVPLPIGKPDLIRYYIPQTAVSFFTIYDKWGEEKLRRICDLGFSTYVLWDNKEKGISGTQIRNAIINGNDWCNYVPKSVYEYVRLNGIDKRIVNMAK